MVIEGRAATFCTPVPSFRADKTPRYREIITSKWLEPSSARTSETAHNCRVWYFVMPAPTKALTPLLPDSTSAPVMVWPCRSHTAGRLLMECLTAKLPRRKSSPGFWPSVYLYVNEGKKSPTILVTILTNFHLKHLSPALLMQDTPNHR